MNTTHENVKFDYYDIECVNLVNKINETDKLRHITASFRGKENNPNIIYTKQVSNVNYQATDIFVTKSIHGVESGSDGEIVILHRPTTTSLKLYACFPYISSSDVSSNTSIDNLISSKSHSLSTLYRGLPMSIELNKYIKPNPKVIEYKTVDKFGEQCIVLFFDSIIKIKTKLNGNTLEEALFVIESEAPAVSLLEDKLKSPSILLEGFHENIKNMRLHKKTENIQNMQQTNTSDVIYQCEYLPVDTEDMVQVLQVPIGSPGHHYGVGNRISGVFVSTTILIFSVLTIFFISPLLYGFIESLVSSHVFLDNLLFFKSRLNINLNLLNLLLILSIFILTAVLLIYGIIYSDVVAVAVSLFLPFFALISYVGITFFRPKI